MFTAPHSQTNIKIHLSGQVGAGVHSRIQRLDQGGGPEFWTFFPLFSTFFTAIFKSSPPPEYAHARTGLIVVFWSTICQLFPA